MRGWTALAAAMAAGAAQAQPPAPPDGAFCAELQRIVAAADDEEPFLALERPRPSPPTLGFRYGCGRAGDARRHYWACSQTLAPDWLGAARLVERTRRCLPEARALPVEHHREFRFDLPGAEIRISEHGGPSAHVGRVVSFTVEATGR